MIKKDNIDFNQKIYFEEAPTLARITEIAMEAMTHHFHAESYNRGWWHDPISGLSLIPGDPEITSETIGKFIKAWFPFVIATKIALIQSETSEMLEAFRSDLMDDKIPFLGVVAEGADVYIRLFDLFGCLQLAAKAGIVVDGEYSVVKAMMAKGLFNSVRADHDFSTRKKKI